MDTILAPLTRTEANTLREIMNSASDKAYKLASFAAADRHLFGLAHGVQADIAETHLDACNQLRALRRVEAEINAAWARRS
jgi:hypothetical protein